MFQIQIVESDQKEENLRSSPPRCNIEADSTTDVDEEATDVIAHPLSVQGNDDPTEDPDEEETGASSASQAAAKLATSDAYIKESDETREMVRLVDKPDPEAVGASADPEAVGASADPEAVGASADPEAVDASASTQQPPPPPPPQQQQTTKTDKPKSKLKKFFSKKKS